MSSAAVRSSCEHTFVRCGHACVYCFARPTHRYLDFDRGRDFEREIVVKVNAPEVPRAELARLVRGRYVNVSDYWTKALSRCKLARH